MYSEFTSASQASWTSVLKGNVRWMAPELLAEREDGSQVRPSEQSDMYSFGGVMLQIGLKSPPELVILSSLNDTGNLSNNVGLLILRTAHRRRELTQRSGMNFTHCPDLVNSCTVSHSEIFLQYTQIDKPKHCVPHATERYKTSPIPTTHLEVYEQELNIIISYIAQAVAFTAVASTEHTLQHVGLFLFTSLTLGRT
ncbi:hypothetical protein BDR07DRAFT_1377105 [Suillus spraguei]|nr:hypothetical protein BDR07DRAFT_1377105 [Suillus spraguei]